MSEGEPLSAIPKAPSTDKSKLRQRYAVSVSVFVIVQDAGDVLLLRRSNTGWKDGYLSLPAGAHDGGETLEQAASRELHEETGLLVAPEYMQLVHLMHCQSGDRGSEWLGAFFLAQRWDGSPMIGEPDKHDQLSWHPIHTLPTDVIPYTKQGIELGISGIPFSTFGW
jgi:8-oxo-dGTP diphosphatase